MAISNKGEQQGELETQPQIRQPTAEFPAYHSFDDAKLVVDTSDYRILDVKYENSLGWCLWTTIWVTLKPNKHSYHMANPNVNMKYTVEDGRMWVLVGVKGEPLQTKQSIVIPAGHGHMVLNQWEKPCLYTVEVPAKMELREYLGVNMPGEEDPGQQLTEHVIGATKAPNPHQIR